MFATVFLILAIFFSVISQDNCNEGINTARCACYKSGHVTNYCEANGWCSLPGETYPGTCTPTSQLCPDGIVPSGSCKCPLSWQIVGGLCEHVSTSNWIYSPPCGPDEVATGKCVCGSKDFEVCDSGDYCAVSAGNGKCTKPNQLCPANALVTSVCKCGSGGFCLSGDYCGESAGIGPCTKSDQLCPANAVVTSLCKCGSGGFCFSGDYCGESAGIGPCTKSDQLCPEGKVDKDCVCGITDCVSRYSCDNTTWVCSPPDPCLIDGVVKQPECMCGSTGGLCVADDFCGDSAGNGTCTPFASLCSAGPVSKEACTCGTTSCALGMVCNLGTGACTAPDEPAGSSVMWIPALLIVALLTLLL